MNEPWLGRSTFKASGIEWIIHNDQRRPPSTTSATSQMEVDGQREAEPTAGADKRKLQSAERARLFYFNLNKARAFRLGVLFRCWRRSISTAFAITAGTRSGQCAICGCLAHVGSRPSCATPPVFCLCGWTCTCPSCL